MALVPKKRGLDDRSHVQPQEVEREVSTFLPQPKRKPIRLKGRALRRIYEAVYDRDGGCCVKCGAWIPRGTIPHHIIHKSQGGEDTMDNLEML